MYGWKIQPGRMGKGSFKNEKGFGSYATPWSSMQLEGGGEGVGMGLTHDEKERHGGIKTGGIHICKTGEMMVFESEKMIWYEISRKSNENVTQKYTPK